MKRRSLIGMCMVLGLSISAFEVAERVIAAEPLPDPSVVAYWVKTPRPNQNQNQNQNQKKKPEQPKVSDVTLTGTIDAVQPTGLKIKASKTTKGKDQKEWLVFARSDSSEFTIHATATVDYLRAGQSVEFRAQTVKDETNADKSSERVTDEVNQLTVFSRKSRLSHKKGGAKDHEADSGAGGDRIEAPKAETDSETTLTVPDEDPKPKAGKPVAKPAAVAGGHKIAGRIASCDQDRKGITVTEGERKIHVALADMPTINVELSDPTLIPDSKDSSKSKIEGKGAGGHAVSMLAGDLVGAQIVVRGTGTESKAGNQCMADSIELTLAKPLTGKSAVSAKKKAPADD